MDFVYDMTWAEFQIRLFAYKRQDLYKWQMLREMMWTCYIAPHQDPKKMVKRKELFLPLGDDRKKRQGVSDEQKEMFLEAYKNYLNQTKWQD